MLLFLLSANTKVKICNKRVSLDSDLTDLCAELVGHSAFLLWFAAFRLLFASGSNRTQGHRIFARVWWFAAVAAQMVDQAEQRCWLALYWNRLLLSQNDILWLGDDPCWWTLWCDRVADGTEQWLHFPLSARFTRLLAGVRFPLAAFRLACQETCAKQRVKTAEQREQRKRSFAYRALLETTLHTMGGWSRICHIFLGHLDFFRCGHEHSASADARLLLCVRRRWRIYFIHFLQFIASSFDNRSTVAR